MKKGALILAAIVPMLWMGPLPAQDHDDEPKHGGIMNWNENSEFTLELVATRSDVIIYIEDHGVLVPTKGAKGQLVVTSGGTTKATELRSDGDNRVIAPGASIANADKAVATLTLPNGSLMLGRYIFR